MNKSICITSCYRSWNLSHPIGCPGYLKPTDPKANDSSFTVCRDLNLMNIECNLPFCPMPNDTKVSGLDATKSMSKLSTTNVSVKAGAYLQYNCLDPSKHKFMLTLQSF